MPVTEMPIHPVRELPPRADTLCLMIELSAYHGDFVAAEGYLLELTAICAGAGVTSEP